MNSESVKHLAQYLSDLEHNLECTNRAEDRRLWEKYLADAARIMWRVQLNAPIEEIHKAIASHEHLLGWSYIAGEVSWQYPGCYSNFKDTVGYETNRS